MNNGKATIEKNFRDISISIPSKKNWFILLFGLMWMGGWVFGFFSTSSILFTKHNTGKGIDAFLMIWLAGWTFGGIMVILTLLWGFFGKELFKLEGRQVIFSKTIFGIGQIKKLEREAIKNFRMVVIDDSFFSGKRNRLSIYGLGEGRIKFDYGFKTYSFGLGVDEAEAEHIVKLLQETFPDKNGEKPVEVAH